MIKTLLAAGAVALVLTGGISAADAAPRRVAVATYAPNANLVGFMVTGAIIGGVAAAVLCPPCAVGHAALTIGGAIAVGAGVGAVGGAVVGTVVDRGLAGQS